ncbi:recombinase family protein [uncultured Sphingomonas sp.]|uniref:recombinase family protein n=1 Tax=uncultured Sphingomonas sp. TaxID=158754 RepID=UPI0025D7A350|nr:recombinase family protein [uncultured Sphingomonas sp.]
MIDAAVACGRKSFDNPDERTSSVDDQQLFAQKYAERCGLEVIAFHGDDGITGATMERPGLQQVLKLITGGKARNLIIEDVDRLSRDAEHLHYMFKLFRLHQVAVHTVVTGKVDDLVLAFKGIIGEQQRMRITYTTRRGLRDKATRGGATGGRVLGYRRATPARMRRDASLISSRFTTSRPNSSAGSSACTRTARAYSGSATLLTRTASPPRALANAASTMPAYGTPRCCRVT